MKGFHYENRDSGTFLVYRMQPGDELDALSLGMVTNNRIPGLLPVLFTQMDDERRFMYNVTSKVSLRQYVSGKMTREKCIRVFGGIAASVLACGEYMLESSVLLTGLDFIFIDVGTGEVSLVCLPVCGREAIGDFPLYFRSILCDMVFNEAGNMDYPALILNSLNAGGNFSLRDFLDFLRGLGEGSGEETSGGESPEPRMDSMPDRDHPSPAHIPDGPANDPDCGPGKADRNGGAGRKGLRHLIDRIIKKRQAPESDGHEPGFAVPGLPYPAAKKPKPVFPREEPLFFGGTAFLGEDDESGHTILLGDMSVAGGSEPYLLRLKTGEKVKIEGDVFKIGKEKSYVDYFIEDNASVSRSHADIIRREEGFCIVDNNSTNRTFLNGRQVPSNEEIPLEDGAEILLGNEGFTFHMS